MLIADGYQVVTFSDIMDLTCPELTTIPEETSDYGSRDTSDTDLVIDGFCIFSHLDGTGEI